MLARAWSRRLARPLLAALAPLQATGQISGYEVRPAQHAVAVWGVQPATAAALASLPNAVGIRPAPVSSSAPSPAAQALADQVLGLSQLLAVQNSIQAPTATPLTIRVSRFPGLDWDTVIAASAPTTSASMRILRRGQEIYTESQTHTTPQSTFLFIPPWHECPNEGYAWRLQPGDIVEVTAAGQTTQTVVANISVGVDPGDDTVSGRTDPGRTVSAELRVPRPGSCTTEDTFVQTVSTDAEGGFSLDFGSLVDFRGDTRGTLCAYDANGHATCIPLHAYHIQARFGDDGILGTLESNASFTAVLERGSHAISTDRGWADGAGGFSASFTDTIRAGDVIRVQGGAADLTYTAPAWQVTLDPVIDQAFGSTAAGRTVKGQFYTLYGPDLIRTGCSSHWGCDVATADGSGHFVLNAGFDLRRGDWGYLNVYDDWGNFQYALLPVPAIAADRLQRHVSGYWGDPSVGQVTVILKSGGVIKSSTPGLAIDPDDGSFGLYLGSSFDPGDLVVVGDGTMTETMTIQNLDARLHGDTGHLTGSAPNSRLVAVLEDFRREQSMPTYHCLETNVGGGSYDLLFSSADVGGQDEALVWSTGPSGHYTAYLARALAVHARLESDRVSGYSETPNTAVQATLRRGGAPIASGSYTSLDNGYWWLFLKDAASNPVPLAGNDTLWITTGDGRSIAVSIFTMTINADPAHNRLYGQAPADDPLTVKAQIGEYSVSQIVTTDSDGDYSADWSGWWWHSEDHGCKAVDVADPCFQGRLDHYDLYGQHVWLEEQDPPLPGPDAFEPDDTPAQASPYTGVQSHTFHTGAIVQAPNELTPTYTGVQSRTFHVSADADWISFTVPADDVNRGIPYILETFDLGWGADTKIVLYDTDGSTQLAQDDNGGEGVASRLEWTPSQAGSYYVKVRSAVCSVRCGATYKLRIARDVETIYLPLILRGQ